MRNIIYVVHVVFLAISQCLKKISVNLLFPTQVEGSSPQQRCRDHYHSPNHPFYYNSRLQLLKLQYKIMNYGSKVLSDNNQQNGSVKCKNRTISHSSTRDSETDSFFIKQFIYKFGSQKRVITYIDGKIRQQNVSLHPNRENFLLIRREHQLLIMDLCFTTISLSQKRNTPGLKSGRKYLCLEEFNGLVIFLFETQDQMIEYYELFDKYKDILIKKFPQYLVCNSSLVKRYIEIQYMGGQFGIDQAKMLKISEQFGFSNIEENLKFFRMHFSGGNSKDKIRNFNQFLMIQFCINLNLLQQFNTYSSEKLKNIQQNPKDIFKKVMKKSQFKQFLKNTQMEREENVQQHTQRLSPMLSLYDFCCFLFDQRVNYVAAAQQIDQNYPLTNYFCYSSHNTYLSGNQITSKSKKCRYTEDLQTGVKCVQIDIHKDGEVTHAFLGLSLSNSLNFQQVIQEIFLYRQDLIRNGLTHYPIILSLQNHVPTLKRETLLSVLAKYFDTSCYYMDENDEQFPTLAQLRGKIVVKTNTKIVQTNVFKLIKQKLQEDISSISSPSQSSSQQDQSKSFDSKSPLSLRINDFKSYHKENNLYMEKAKSKRQKLLRKIRKSRSKKSSHEPMVTVTGIFKSKNGIQNKNPSSFVCTSLTSKKALKKNPQKVLRYTQNSWLRVYPKNSAIRSSNYNPANFLQLGAQMIALNTQTKDDYALMMHCYFSAGRNQSAPLIGYMLKPQYLLPQQFQPPQNILTYLRITTLMNFGQRVKLKFIGVDEDNQRNKHSKDSFTFKNPNQSFIIFDIGQKAKECVAIRFIRQGYRVIIGRNPKTFKDMGIRILIHIKRKIIQ